MRIFNKSYNCSFCLTPLTNISRIATECGQFRGKEIDIFLMVQSVICIDLKKFLLVACQCQHGCGCWCWCGCGIVTGHGIYQGQRRRFIRLSLAGYLDCHSTHFLFLFVTSAVMACIESCGELHYGLSQGKSNKAHGMTTY